MADKPIPFRKDMVRAILEGRKTQTRRIFNPQPPSDHNEALFDDAGWFTCKYGDNEETRHKLPISSGDRLYVREAWRAEHCYDPIPPRDIDPRCPVFYEADRSDDLKSNLGRFRQGMHMPKWASRITLIVNTVRVQRLQAISERDAISEGCRPFFDHENTCQVKQPNGGEMEMAPLRGSVEQFQPLWDSINADRGFGWDQNPWVAAYTFTPIFKNILEVKDDD